METLTKKLQAYYTSLVAPKRLPTREVPIGDIPLGGQNPIRIQSMTTTDTLDTEATVAQCIRLAEAGCEYIRITAPSQKEAENLSQIKKRLRAAGFNTPLVADIHYTPKAAEIAARIVEKVRINPGNYADKKKFEFREYTPQTYQAELERIRERFVPLVRICKEYGTALRIGVNHGSLSDRIMSYYGDTPQGMVESAMEFVQICEDEGFYNLVISMKASNPQIMVQAYRLLVARLKEHGIIYPIHLGVTEAGDGVDGRIKSALGIGTLLAEGIGDTVRVSLTEPPENEIPAARSIVSFFTTRKPTYSLPHPPQLSYDPYRYERQCQITHEKIGKGFPAIVIASHTQPGPIGPYSGEAIPDFVYLGQRWVPSHQLPTLPLYDAALWEKANEGLPFFESFAQWENFPFRSSRINFVQITSEETDKAYTFAQQNPNVPIVWVLADEGELPLIAWRWIRIQWGSRGYFPPVVGRLRLPELSDIHELSTQAACHVGLPLIDGLLDGLWLEGPRPNALYARVSFDILQGARARITRTEYIACPSCGRTLFDLEKVTAQIRSQTNHLKGVKIAIMGCIVNGPGEMADADYGYVGAGPGTIHLYKGKDIVRRNVKEDEALQALIELIQADGKWIDPPTA